MTKHKELVLKVEVVVLVDVVEETKNNLGDRLFDLKLNNLLARSNYVPQSLLHFGTVNCCGK